MDPLGLKLVGLCYLGPPVVYDDGLPLHPGLLGSEGRHEGGLRNPQQVGNAGHHLSVAHRHALVMVVVGNPGLLELHIPCNTKTNSIILQNV